MKPADRNKIYYTEDINSSILTSTENREGDEILDIKLCKTESIK